ncbi:hypothetical protein A3L09_01240 [Thermococcus profundus]|uniref:Uncharacterized protein n=1 Tax=Thermococcus profundus TaxID=49899 RepID=A0A2Z2MIM0_THEPR|nr:hypothetical protein A3L09_01240 [Thermococcus profundus]
MVIHEPVNLAMPLAKVLGETIRRNRRLPDGNDLREVLKGFGLEEICLDRGIAVFRGRTVVAMAFPRDEPLVVDVISSSGELSDALEVVAYLDRKLNAFIVEIVPANDIEYEGNIGLEPVIIDAESFELKSSPVLGHFEEEEGSPFLVIDRETYEHWKENGNTDICPICGGELAWKGERAYCLDCGYGVKVVKK